MSRYASSDEAVVAVLTHAGVVVDDLRRLLGRGDEGAGQSEARRCVLTAATVIPILSD